MSDGHKKENKCVINNYFEEEMICAKYKKTNTSAFQ